MKALRERMDHLAGRWSFLHAPMSSNLCLSHFTQRHLFSHSFISPSFLPSFALSVCYFPSFTTFRLAVAPSTTPPPPGSSSFQYSKGRMVSEFSIFFLQIIYREVMTRISFGSYIWKLGQIHKGRKCNHFRSKDPYRGDQGMSSPEVATVQTFITKVKVQC